MQSKIHAAACPPNVCCLGIAVELTVQHVNKLRDMSPLWEMVQVCSGLLSNFAQLPLSQRTVLFLQNVAFVQSAIVCAIGNRISFICYRRASTYLRSSGASTDELRLLT